MNDPGLKYKIGIELIPKVGSINAKRLIAYCGSPEAVFRESKRNLLRIPGIGEVIAHEIANQKILDKAEAEVEFIEKYRISALYYADADYPERLKHCEDGPVVLFVKSSPSLNFNTDKVISVVGTRRATAYGKAICDELIGRIAAKGYSPIIVSGLAYGIDIAAHRAALRHRLPTVAALGHGLNTIYPTTHRDTAEEILGHGALVTDFVSEAPFDRNNFLRRNRIIAGLADATIIVESAETGGALVTADIANSYNREVFAVPGNVTATYSRGCNQLIKQSKAALVESADDVEFLLGWKPGTGGPPGQTALRLDTFTPDEQRILSHLRSHGAATIDRISVSTGIPVPKALSLLLGLEFSGAVASRPGKVFALTST